MASTAKYTPAPTQEPHDDYTEAPPTYGSSSASRHDQDLLLGARRASQDNLPDDFKFGGSVAEATTDIRNQFIRKVYAILTVQLLATAAVSSLSFMNEGYKSFVQSHVGLAYLSIFASLGFLGLTWWKRMSYPTNLLFLSGFTLSEAYSISLVVSLYDSRTVLLAVVLTGAIFVFLTLFACQSKYDFASWQPYLFGGLWAMIMFGMMAMFLPYNSTAELVYGLVGALIFSAYVLVDTQLVMRRHHVEEEIAAAISLYLDVINLFLSILRILNSQNNN